MGLFSFFKKAGSKALVEEEKKAEKSHMAEEMVKKAKLSVFTSIVKSLDLPIEDLQLDLDGDTIIVAGTTDSHENREKIILALGNVNGIAAVDDRIYVDAPKVESQFHTVEKGDTLGKIAKKYYGNAMKYPVIFEANKPMLEHPDRIYPGQNLRIPSLEA